MILIQNSITFRIVTIFLDSKNIFYYNYIFEDLYTIIEWKLINVKDTSIQIITKIC